MGSRPAADGNSPPAAKKTPPPPPPRCHQRRPPSSASAAANAGSPPCGACKFLRRKCAAGCVFAPHFGAEQGPARFAAVHRVFGASNVSKLLLRLPHGRRGDAAATVCFEAHARVADPVYGCVATILALQQQVAALQAELSLVQAQLMSCRLAVASAIQNAQHLTCIVPGSVAAPPPANSNTSSASSDLLNLSGHHHLDLGPARHAPLPLDTKLPEDEYAPFQR